MGPIDEAYLDWLRRQPCQVDWGRTRCVGAIQAHHIFGRGMGGSKRDDRDCVSLCVAHHSEYHTRGCIAPFDHADTRYWQLETAHMQLKEYLEYAAQQKGQENQKVDDEDLW